MTSRLLLPLALLAVAGLSLVFGEIPWFRRRPIADRLAPYHPGASGHTRSGVLSVASLRDVVAPLAHELGGHLARLAGISEPLEDRLRRIHSPTDPTSFRVRQLGRAGVALAATAAVVSVADLPDALGALLVLGSPVLTFLVIEQQLAAASAAWQRRLFLELPVVAEQLGMLTGAGWSLGAALGRIATRGSGACSADLARVTRRMRQGLSEIDALREWARLADVEALNRLVAVLALNREASDLGRLVAEEARSIRREAQRELIATIERRNQQVWIPVTVAALVPGVLLMGIPFVDALRLFGA